MGSSSTWSRTSTSSCTSDATGGDVRARTARVLRAARLVHPFPSILDAVATAAIAFIAGAAVPTALRLALAMAFIQFGIGAANDAADMASDRDRAEKPVASGVVSRRTAMGVALGCAGIGLVLAAPSGFGVLALASAGLALGLVYDLWLKRTPLAWLPLSAGIPLLVLFAWSGSGADLGPEVALVLPAGALAGGALALGNGLVDPDADAAAGMSTPVVVLGPRIGRPLAAGLLVAALALAAGSLIWLDAAAPLVAAVLGAGVVAIAGPLAAQHPDRGRRERAWELEAIGVGLLGAAWIAGLVATRA